MKFKTLLYFQILNLLKSSFFLVIPLSFLVVISLTGLFQGLFLQGKEKILVDLALGFFNLGLHITALYLGAQHVKKEMGFSARFFYFTKPISSTTYLLSKILTATFFLLLFCGIFGLGLNLFFWKYDIILQVTLLPVYGSLFLQALIIYIMAVFFSFFLPQFLTYCFSALIYFYSFLLIQAQEVKNLEVSFQKIIQGLLFLLPPFPALNLKSEIFNPSWSQNSWSHVKPFLHGGIYFVIFVLLIRVIFKNPRRW